MAEKEKEKKEEVADTTRDWTAISDPLECVLRRLFSSPDVHDHLSFASVCRSWRAVSVSAAAPPFASFPPLLLHPALQTLSTVHRKRRHVTTGFLMETLTLKPCLGYTRSHLVFLTSRKLLLANVFTGKLTRIRSPSPRYTPFHLALLTPTNLLLLNHSNELVSYRPDTRSWSKLLLGPKPPYVKSLCSFRGQVYGLAAMSRLVVVRFQGTEVVASQLVAEAAPPRPRPFCFGALREQMVDCDGRLMIIQFVVPNHWMQQQVQVMNVFAMDFAERRWVVVRSLGNWCIFIDKVSVGPVACPDPARWGGRSNCVYVVTEAGIVAAVPMEGPRLVVMGDGPAGEKVDSQKVIRWPSEVWVCPSNKSDQLLAWK